MACTHYGGGQHGDAHMGRKRRQDLAEPTENPRRKIEPTAHARALDTADQDAAQQRSGPDADHQRGKTSRLRIEATLWLRNPRRMLVGWRGRGGQDELSA